MLVYTKTDDNTGNRAHIYAFIYISQYRCGKYIQILTTHHLCTHEHGSIQKMKLYAHNKATKDHK